MSLIEIFFNSLIIISLLLLVYNIGNEALYYFFQKKSFFAFPLGLVILLGFFHFVSILFINSMASYNIYFILISFLFIPAFIISNYFTFKKITKKKLKFDSYVFIIYLIAIVYGIYLFIFSVPYIDSWLFGPLSLLSSESGFIYSLDGIYRYTSPVHGYDSFYLFQNVLSTFAIGDDVIFISAFLKFFEGFIVIMSFAFFSELLFKKDRKVFSFLLIIGTVLFAKIFTNSFYYDTSYPSVFLMEMSFTGTSLLFFILIPLLIFITNTKSSIRNFPLLLAFVILFAFSCSSSSLYMLPAAFLVSMIYDIFINKKYSINNFIILFPFFITECVLMIIGPTNIIVIVIFIISCIISYLFYTKSNELFQKLCTILFISILIVVVIFLVNKFNITFEMFLGTSNYKILTPIFIVGMFYCYKKYYSVFWILIISGCIFNNGLAIQISNNTPLVDVYPRVLMLASLYYFNILGVVCIINFIKIKKIKIVLILGIAIYFFVESIGIPVHNYDRTRYNIRPFEEYESFLAYKLQYPEVYYFGNYEYNQNATLVVPPSNTYAPRIEYNGIFLLNPTMIQGSMDICNENCYIIIPTSEVNPEGFESVDEFGDFKLIYKE